jgi:hypothetical protein
MGNVASLGTPSPIVKPDTEKKDSDTAPVAEEANK